MGELKAFVQETLATRARELLKRFNPRVIAITGSVGKTSTKDAIAHVLRRTHKVLETKGNLNTDFGLPLTILGLRPAYTAVGWGLVTARATMYNPRSYYDVLVLEYGIDHPGDMAVLASIAAPHIVVETGVESVHLEFFANRNELIQEKASLLDYLPDDGLALCNADNEASRDMVTRTGNWKRIMYGTDESAEVRATDIQMDLTGMKFSVHIQGTAPFTVTTPLLGKHHVSVLLPALALAEKFGISTGDAAEALRSFQLPAGRLNKLDGIKKSTLIDSSYNAEPASMKRALETLRELPAKRRFAVLGDMLELGESSEAAHAALVNELAGIDTAVFVGEQMLPVYRLAIERKVVPHAVHFEDSADAAEHLPSLVQAEDLVLIKGSQGMRMERITKALLRDPADAPKLLVRQSNYWLRKE